MAKKFKYIAGGPLKYTSGYKFWIDDDHWLITDMIVREIVDSSFLRIEPIYDGKKVIGSKMFIKKGFATDGKSGPGIQTKKTKIPAMYHDLGYRLIRLGLLPKSYRIQFDVMYRELNEQQGGFTKFMANVWHWVLRKYGKKAAYKKRKVHKAYLR